MHVLLTALLAAGVGSAAAHASLETSQPAAESTVSSPLDEVRLSFTEPVELVFSLFEVHSLDASFETSDEDAWPRLNGLAAALAADALGSDDADTRVDVVLANEERRTDEVVLRFEQELEPGVYAVLWRALSVDTHTVQGVIVFEYAPETQP